MIAENHKSIFLKQLNEIVLFNEGNDITKDENKNNKKRNIIIFTCVIAGIIMIAGILALLIIIKIKK